MKQYKNKQSIYLETSAISAYFDHKNQDPIRKAITQEFWHNILPNYQVYVSDITIIELKAAEEKYKVDLIKILKNFIELKSSDKIKEIEKLVDSCINEKLFPRSKRADAIHVILAAVNDVDFIISWNHAHFTRPHRRKLIQDFMIKYKLFVPEITTPEELLLSHKEQDDLSS